jgi:hypothetical protein
VVDKKTLFLIGNDLVTALSNNCPVNTGALKNSIWFKIDGNDIIISMKKYGKNVEFGTPPHVIEPKKAKALHWKGDGGDIFAKKVNHPGTRPQPFIRSTMKNKLPSILQRRMKNGNS